MEHPDIGQQCSVASCKQLDFLPFTCAYCEKVFCKHHFGVLLHGCPSAESASSASPSAGDVQKFACTFEECESRSPVQMLCPECQKHYCLAHRHHSCFNISPEELEQKKKEWIAPKQQFAQSIKNVNDSLNESIRKAQEKPKSRATANKVQLMRLKGKAKGQANIPTTDRVYFMTVLPKKYQSGIKEVYVSRHWTVGRVIDSIADLSNVANRNNEQNAPKLRLFKRLDGEQLSCDLSVSLDHLITHGVIIDGDSLVLEFIPENQDLDSYSWNVSNLA